jgi:hypothetical protein
MTRRRVAGFAFVFAAVIACSSTTAPTPSSLAGTWTLHTVNGTSLPFTITLRRGSRPTELHVLSGAIVIRENGTWAEQLTLRQIQGSADSTGTNADSGTYQIRGESISFDKYEPPVSEFDHRIATTNGDKILLPTFPLFLVYKKR